MSGFALLALACGHSSGGAAADDVAADSSDVDVVCESQCGHEQRCGEPPEQSCVSDCRARLGEPRRLSLQALEIYGACLDDPACIDDDICEDRMQTRAPAIEQQVEACLAFVRTCPFESDLSACLRIAALVPDLRARLEQCYVGTCEYDSLNECVSAAYAG